MHYLFASLKVQSTTHTQSNSPDLSLFIYNLYNHQNADCSKGIGLGSRDMSPSYPCMNCAWPDSNKLQGGLSDLCSATLESELSALRKKANTEGCRRF